MHKEIFFITTKKTVSNSSINLTISVIHICKMFNIALISITKIELKLLKLHKNILNYSFFLLSLTQSIIEKILFWRQISEIEIFIQLYVLRYPELENQIFSGWPLCVLVCVRKRKPVISTILKKLEQRFQIRYSKSVSLKIPFKAF